MLNKVQFQSNFYKPILWRNIIESGFKAVESDLKNIAIIGQNNIIISLNQYSENSAILAHGNGFYSKILLNNLSVIDCNNLNILDIYLYSCSDSDILNKKELSADFYNSFVFTVLKSSYSSLKTIFVYTYEHLKSRKIENIVLAQKELIQNQLSEIIIDFSILDDLFINKNSDDKNQAIMSKLILTADRLTKLSGARAMLDNNIASLMFHLKLFEKLFIQVN